jgi:hypothetical protein
VAGSIAVTVLRLGKGPEQGTEIASVLQGTPQPAESVTTPSQQSPPRQIVPETSSAKQPALVGPTQAIPDAEPTPETRLLVEKLITLEPENGILTEEFAGAWKQNLQLLVKQGPAAIPAIREFLAKNLDTVFGDEGRQMLGYSSARVATFEALTQIGGSEGVAALSGVLQITADPMEIALLAQDLEKLEPQQHQSEVLSATRQALDIAGGHKLESTDVAPLFEVLEKYGGADAVKELEKAAGQWNYYGTMALAQLPDGAGIPSLVQIVQDQKTTTGARDGAIQMLAQASDLSPGARAALLEQARLNGISDFAWHMLVPVLGGDQVGFVNSAFEHQQGLPQVGGLRTSCTSDNQTVYAMPGSLTADQLNQRIALIDELLAVTSNPSTKGLLEQQRSALSSRASAVIASGP